MSPPLKRHVVYTRVSTEDQAREGVSLIAQREACLTLCKLRNFANAEAVWKKIPTRRIRPLTYAAARAIMALRPGTLPPPGDLGPEGAQLLCSKSAPA